MSLLASASCARLPAALLPRLGPLRARGDVGIILRDAFVWAFWPAGVEEVAALVLALPGATLFVLREGRLYPANSALPMFDAPKVEDAQPLPMFLSPASIQPVQPGERPVPLTLTLTPDTSESEISATALLTTLTALAAWGDRAPSHDLERLTACQPGTRSPGHVLLRGSPLPFLAGQRFHGQSVLLPLGQRLEPDLAPEFICLAIRAKAGDVVLFTSEGAELIPAAAFAPLTRAGVRLARGPRP